MEREGNYDVRPPFAFTARGKPCSLTKHAQEAMLSERPKLTEQNIEHVLGEPDHDDGQTAWKRIGGRTILIRYEEDDVEIRIKTASATRRRLRP